MLRAPAYLKLQAVSVLVLLRETRSDDQPVLMIASFVLTAAVAICLLPLIAFHFLLILLGMVGEAYRFTRFWPAHQNPHHLVIGP